MKITNPLTLIGLVTALVMFVLLMRQRSCEREAIPPQVVIKTDTVYVPSKPDTVTKIVRIASRVIKDTVYFSTFDTVIIHDKFLSDSTINRMVTLKPAPIEVIHEPVIYPVSMPSTDKTTFSQFYGGIKFSSLGAKYSGPAVSFVNKDIAITFTKPVNDVRSFEITAQFRLGKRKR